MSRFNIAWPGPARISLVALALVPAAMAYPWETARERTVTGVGVVVAILLLASWRGLHLTTMAKRRLAMLRSTRGERSVSAGPDVRTTAVLRVTPPVDDADVLPLPLIATYLDRYGIRADTVRITSRDTDVDGAPQRETWIGLTVSGAQNLAALQARSPQIPLYETAEVTARRLADHLRESGWEVTGSGADDIPELFDPSARETWHALHDGANGYLAAYGLNPDAALPETLSKVWAQPGRETWTVIELAGTATGRTVASACALFTQAVPGNTPPIAGLIPQSGNQRPALLAVDPLSAHRLDGHVPLPDRLLTQLRWPSAAGLAGSRARHAALN